MKLTQRAIDAFVFEGATPTAFDVRPDDEVSGLGVRVWPSGTKTFVLRYRFEGRQRYLTLGNYGDITLQQARELAHLRRADVIQGIDPLEERRTRRRGDTFADLARGFIESYAKGNKDTWKDDEQQLRDHVLPVLRHLKLKAITPADIRRVKERIGNGGYKITKTVQKKNKLTGEKYEVKVTRTTKPAPTTANRVLSLLSKMFNWAKTSGGYMDRNSANPVTGLERYPENERERDVTEEEMPFLARAIEADSNATVRRLVWLSLLFGPRCKMLRTMKWEYVREDDRLLVFPVTKAGRIAKKKKPLVVPMTNLMYAILREIPRIEGNPYVFVGREPGPPYKPFNGVGKAWTRIKERAQSYAEAAARKQGKPCQVNLMDLWWHDSRRFVGNWLLANGYSLATIGKVLHHASEKTTKRYARLQVDAIAEPLEQMGNRLLEHARIIDVAAVPLPARAASPSASAAPPAEPPSTDAGSPAGTDEARP